MSWRQPDVKRKTVKSAAKDSPPPTTSRKSATSPIRSQVRASRTAGRTDTADHKTTRQGRLVSDHLRKALDAGVDMLKGRARRAAGQYGLMDNERDPHDNYETPPEAVDQLLSNESLVGGCFDPSCGRGNIVVALLDAGVWPVLGVDLYRHERLVHRQVNDEVIKYRDFFDFMECMFPPRGTNNIVMNPPYSAADDHVRHALKIIGTGGVVCVLLRLTWIAAQKRADLLKHLHKIIICGRLKMLPPDVPDQGHNGAVDFAWFVFGQRIVDATHIVRAK
jgi:hypothetical protein